MGILAVAVAVVVGVVAAARPVAAVAVAWPLVELDFAVDFAAWAWDVDLDGLFCVRC